MAGREVEQYGLGNTSIDPDAHRRLAVHCADRVGAQYPHEHDADDPRLAGRQLAHNPEVRAELLQLLDAIGYRTTGSHPRGNPMPEARTLPHDPYIDAIEAALTEAKLTPEQADTFTGDSYDVPHLRAVITLTPETSGIPADRFPHGLILIWDWHTGLDEDEERGASWQWARLNEDGSSRWPFEALPVPGWVAPEMLAATVATLAHTGKATPMSSTWHDHLRRPVVAACEAWGENEAAS